MCSKRGRCASRTARSSLTWHELLNLLDRVDNSLALLSVAACGLWSAGHALLNKRDPRSALVWVSISLTIPIFGPMSYWLLGINRITRRALQWKSHRQADSPEVLSSQRTAAALLPELYDPLRDIETLSNKVARLGLTAGNRITPLENGEAAYPAMLSAISGARSSLHLSSYIFDGDGVGAAFVDALRGAAGRGVAVRVIVDAMGERYSSLTARTALKGSGVDIRHYLPLHQAPFINLRNHRKLLVVDGAIAFTGGMNIRSNHCCALSAEDGLAYDLHFRVDGPAVADLQRIFLEDWHFISGQIPDAPELFPELPPAGEAFVRTIADGPDREFHKLEWLLYGALATARHRIRIMTPYFVPDRPQITALVTAALRGVKITLVLPGKNNLPFVSWASRASYWELLKHDIVIVEQPPPFVHTKLMVVDDLWCLIGSANWDTRSLRLNFELNLSVFDQGLSRELNHHFDDALSLSKVVSLQEVDGRPLPVKLRDGVARLFSPYL